MESLTTRHWDNVMREWERDKARILSAVAGGGGGQGAGADMSELSLARDMSTSFVSRTRDTGVSTRGADTTLVTSSLSHHELQYARAVTTYNSSVAGGGIKPDLLASLSELWSEEREPEVTTVWDMVRAMSEVGRDRQAVNIVNCAKKYLEKSYQKFIRLV